MRFYINYLLNGARHEGVFDILEEDIKGTIYDFFCRLREGSDDERLEVLKGEMRVMGYKRFLDEAEILEVVYCIPGDGGCQRHLWKKGIK